MYSMFYVNQTCCTVGHDALQCSVLHILTVNYLIRVSSGHQNAVLKRLKSWQVFVEICVTVQDCLSFKFRKKREIFLSKICLNRHLQTVLLVVLNLGQ